MTEVSQAQEPHNHRKAIFLFGISLIVALGLTYFLSEAIFTDSQVYVLFLLFFALGLWLTEAIPAFAVSLFIMAFLVFALGNGYINKDPQAIDKYVTTFSSSVIWLMLGGFFLASAMSKTKLDAALFKLTLKLSGTKPRGLLVGLMVTTMFASMLMSNTATTAMVVAAIAPLLSNMDKKSGLGKALLLGVAIAATIGGMGTIIGTPANAIAVGALEHEGISIGFIGWLKFGAPLALVLTFLACIVLMYIFIKDNTPLSLDFLNKEEESAANLHVQQKIVLAVILVTISLWLTTSLHGLTVSSICAVPLVFLTLLGVLNGKDIQALPWDTLLLVAGGLSLGLALEQTNLLTHYSQKLIDMEISTMLLIFCVGFITMIVSNIMSNTAASTVMIPLAMTILVSYKMEAALIVAFASSSAMFLPVSTPPNAIAFSTGLLDQRDFRIGGILIGLLGPGLAILWILALS